MHRYNKFYNTVLNIFTLGAKFSLLLQLLASFVLVRACPVQARCKDDACTKERRAARQKARVTHLPYLASTLCERQVGHDIRRRAARLALL